MALTQTQETKLRSFLEGMAIDPEGKEAELNDLLHDVFVSKSAKFFESITSGTDAVKATVKKTADEEIKASGESKDDPKKAKGEASVKASVKKTADEEIKASGESKDDPKKAKGEASVKASVKKTADEEIKK